jgi:hypothetical protein
MGRVCEEGRNGGAHEAVEEVCVREVNKTTSGPGNAGAQKQEDGKMRTLRGVVLALCTLLLCATLGPGGRADTWNKKTIVTFSEAVEIPGQVLPAGTYVFKLADFISDRHCVQIWNGDESQILATIFAVPSERLETTDRSMFEFEERRGDSPMALKYWFYPGDSVGQEFTYSYHLNESYNR